MLNDVACRRGRLVYIGGERFVYGEVMLLVFWLLTQPGASLIDSRTTVYRYEYM